jgi:hypothetical protein
VAFGLALALIGLFLFNAGLESGLSNIGRQAAPRSRPHTSLT